MKIIESIITGFMFGIGAFASYIVVSFSIDFYEWIEYKIREKL